MKIEKIVVYYLEKERALYLWLLLPFGGDYLERQLLVDGFVEKTQSKIARTFGTNTECVIKQPLPPNRKFIHSLKTFCPDVEWIS